MESLYRNKLKNDMLGWCWSCKSARSGKELRTSQREQFQEVDCYNDKEDDTILRDNTCDRSANASCILLKKKLSCFDPQNHYSQTASTSLS